MCVFSLLRRPTLRTEGEIKETSAPESPDLTILDAAPSETIVQQDQHDIVSGCRGRSDAAIPRDAAPKRSHVPRGQSGLTLIEVLVSVVILSIIIVPIFDGFMRGRMLVAHRGEKRMALRLVERKVEQLLDAGYGSQGPDANILSLNVDPGTHPQDPSIVVNTRGDDEATNDVLGELTWDVVQTAWSSPGDSVYVKMVDVKVRWPEPTFRDSVTASFMLGG